MVATDPVTAASDAPDALALNMAAWTHAQAGNYDAALPLLQQVLASLPNDPMTLTSLGGVYREMGRLRDAVLSCDAAIAAAPGHAPSWLERGFVMTAGGSIDAAFECYGRAAMLDPSCAAAYAGMAAIAARRGDSDVARRHAEAALALDPGNVIATCALATVEIECGDTEFAVSRLTLLVSVDTDVKPERVLALNLLGEALDKAGQVDEAFAAYRDGKEAFNTLHSPQFAIREQSHRQFIEMIADGVYALDDVQAWAIPSHVTSPKHVFLLGYPRSGTTLVENILASLPDTMALEERPTLREADQAFLGDSQGIARLAALTRDGSKQFQEAYWARVTAARAMPPASGTFVDMDPLKGTRLPIIARLFPDARILIMRRDPRDVVLSCFRTNFALTNAAAEFTDLERTARHYDAMMRLIDLCTERLPIRSYTVRYDQIVHNFDNETRAICAFLAVDWSLALRNFDRTAMARGVSTASAAQVRKPLYDGTRQWERYAKYLAPVMPILQPWVNKFGYES